MCIRDRHLGTQYLLNIDSKRLEVSVREGLVQVGEHAGTQAVSYTHLRAHETVLDLVCRLLLEKKKTDNMLQSSTLYKTDIIE